MIAKNKSICLVTNLAFSDEPTVKNRLEPYITESLKNGIDVTLVSGDDSSIVDTYTKSVKHIKTSSKNIRPASFISRAFFEWRESRKILKVLQSTDYDIYILTIPSMFLLFNLNLLKQKKIVLDVRDLTWEYLRDSVLIEKLAKKNIWIYG